MNSVFVYCELAGQKVADVSLELLTKGRSLADQLGVALECVVIGKSLDAVPQQISKYGVDTIHLFDDERLYPYTTLPHAAIVVQLFRAEQPQICLVGATVVGRDLAPRVSSALHSGLTADCTALEIGSFDMKKKNDNGEMVTVHYDNQLYQIRPAFGGNIVATIVNPDHRPQMATVREGVMRRAIYDEGYKSTVVRHDVAKYVKDSDFVITIVDRHVKKAKHHLQGAAIVVAGGYGVGSKEGFDSLFALAKELHAEVGASRAAIDAGFVDADRQIGQTGLTVRPKVYFAFGISGQIQHISGMQEAGIIVSVNTDPDAPINKIADYVIVGAVEDVVPKMIEYYKKNNK